MRRGDLPRDRVWRAFRANYRYVLDDVALLLDSVDADRIVLTADHGNAFGEWGLWGHPDRIPIRVLREVPWIVTSASDSGEYEPDLALTTPERTDDAGADEADPTDEQVADRLAALGYI